MLSLFLSNFIKTSYAIINSRVHVIIIKYNSDLNINNDYLVYHPSVITIPPLEGL